MPNTDPQPHDPDFTLGQSDREELGEPGALTRFSPAPGARTQLIPAPILSPDGVPVMPAPGAAERIYTPVPVTDSDINLPSPGALTQIMPAPGAMTQILPTPGFDGSAPAPFAPPPAAEAKAAPEAPPQNGAEVVAPPPDTPFGAPVEMSAQDLGALSGIHLSAAENANAALSRVRAPMPSGYNWRSVMSDVPVAPPKPVLVAKGLIKWFGKRQVVQGVDVEVGAGEIVGLLGRNGAGKTTTFRMIMGLLHPDGGNVKYENRDVTRLPMYARANRGIGYLAQQPSVFQKLSVEENLMAVLELQEPSSKQRKARMEDLIEKMGLAKVRKSQAAVLSGGERRRLEIARAMSLHPRVVLFDEPFAGIDPITVSEIQGILRDLKGQGVGVLVTDHNVRETLTITDRTYIMDEGKIWIHGHPRDIVANEEARSRYLGHEFRLDF